MDTILPTFPVKISSFRACPWHATADVGNAIVGFVWCLGNGFTLMRDHSDFHQWARSLLAQRILQEHTDWPYWPNCSSRWNFMQKRTWLCCNNGWTPAWSQRESQAYLYLPTSVHWNPRKVWRVPEAVLHPQLTQQSLPNWSQQNSSKQYATKTSWDQSFPGNHGRRLPTSFKECYCVQRYKEFRPAWCIPLGLASTLGSSLTLYMRTIQCVEL